MEGRPERIADYFVVVGVGNESISKFKQFSSEEEVALPADKSVPEAITDIAVFYSKYEQLPKGYRYVYSIHRLLAKRRSIIVCLSKQGQCR